MRGYAKDTKEKTKEKAMNKNYQIQIGTLKVSAMYHEPKGDRKRGNYSVAITKSTKDQDGNWKDQTVYLFPEETFVISEMLKKIQSLFTKATEFEIKPKEQPQGVELDDIDKVAGDIGMTGADDIPF